MSTVTFPTPTTTSAVSTTVADRAFATLVLAFSADPIVRWMLPDGTRYLDDFPRFLALMGDVAVPAGTVDLLPGDVGAALWHPPGAELDAEAAADLLTTSVTPARHAGAFGLLEAMAAHHPEEPVWYLPFVGVDPSHQGRGHGSTLLARGLARCDRDGLPAYLEASSPRNRALYERHGFRTLTEIRVADSPPLWPMLRPAGVRT